MTTAMFDGREMLMLHDVFRREFSLMPRAVRATTAGDTERANAVGAHLTAVSTMLHNHHSLEDAQVWPLLTRLAPDEANQYVGLMEDQHKKVADLGDEVNVALREWQATATEQARETLAQAIEHFVPTLKEHLATEEKNVVPLMEKCITLEASNVIGQKAGADTDPDLFPLLFGMMMYEAPADIVDLAISNMPPEVGTTIRQVAPQRYAAQAELVYGTATPSRSTELN